MKTKASENGFKSGAFWQSIISKTLRFECGQVKTVTEKSHIVPSISFFKRLIRENAILKGEFLNENAAVWTGENKSAFSSV